ncbi:hypothetical protein [Mesorhizobium sp. Z1-4]|uniref:hypothetical protein n=1 Tax=Mesorhizobium sp. Z1-4 TaxID=2448478 RepID=UPI000FD71A66|nr:hypothetical protein [Mesorhizobium sp. Z1-4]
MTIELVSLSEFSDFHNRGWRMVPGYPLNPGDYAVTMMSPNHRLTPLLSNSRRGAQSAEVTRKRREVEIA